MRWTSKSVRKLSEELKKLGFKTSHNLVAEILKEAGYSLQANQKSLEGSIHPDHIGAAKSIKIQTGCTIFAHQFEQAWIEDTEQQFKDRPVPGFDSLVGGPVKIDNLLDGNEDLQNIMELCKKVVMELGLPPLAADPLVAIAFASSLAA